MTSVRAAPARSTRSAMAHKLTLGIYEHYKGNKYQVIGVAKHSETLEDMVVYEALYGDGDLFVRPLGMFLENVQVAGELVPRFRFLDGQA